MQRISSLTPLLALTLLSYPAYGESLLDAPAEVEPADPPPAGRSGRLIPVPDVPAARDVEPGPDLLDRNGDGIADGLAARLAGAPANQRFDVIATFTTQGRAAAALQALGRVELRHEYDLIPGFAASLNTGQLNALTQMRGVVRVEEVAPVYAFMEAERRDFGVDAAQLDITSGGLDVDGSGVAICVIDTGVFAEQEQLDSKVIGFADFVGTSPDPAPYDNHGHGTHVSSIAVGDGTAPDGGDQVGANRYRGVAPGASLYVAKVLDANGSGDSADVIAGVDWCVEQGVDVINLSLGEPGSSDGNDALSTTVNAAVAEGVVVIVAGGNGGAGPYTIGSPGAASEVITVGAVAEWSTSTEPAGESDGVYLAPFSSRGPTADNRIKPDIVAPGVSVIAGYPDLWAGTILEAGCNPECYASQSGTSMAAPFTAGTVALMLQANPALTPQQVKDLLRDTAQDRGSDAGVKDNDWGHGVLDVHEAVAAAASLGSAPTSLPTYAVGTAQVSGRRSTSVPIPVDDTSAPLAVTMTILDGAPQFLCDPFLGCFYEWRPDFDVRLRDPNGNVVAEGICMLGSLYGLECGNVGRQETVHIPTPLAGEYTLEVYKGTSDSGNGSFRYEVSQAPLAASSPPPPPANNPPVAQDDAVETDEDTAIAGDLFADNGSGADSDPDGDSLTVAEVDGAASAVGQQITLASGALVTVNSEGTFDYDPNGAFEYLTDVDSAFDSFNYTISDGNGDTDTATVTVTVTGVTDGGTPPPADDSMHIHDVDGTSTNQGGTWTATVTVLVHNNDGPVEGATVAGLWSNNLSDDASCLTALAGTCSVISSSIRKREGSVTFRVTGLTHPSLTSSGATHDPDGDFDGTSITVPKP